MSKIYQKFLQIIGKYVDSGGRGVNNTSADCTTKFENVYGVLGEPYFDSGNDSNDLLVNGDKGFCTNILAGLHF